MAFYRVRCRDYRDNVYVTHYIEHDQDQEAIAAAYRMSVHGIETAGFEVWDDERLIHRHQKTDESIRTSSYHLADHTNLRTGVSFVKK
jgi:hypothetical protein